MEPASTSMLLAARPGASKRCCSQKRTIAESRRFVSPSSVCFAIHLFTAWLSSTLLSAISADMEDASGISSPFSKVVRPMLSMSLLSLRILVVDLLRLWRLRNSSSFFAVACAT